MQRTSSNFRAMRELLGLSQHDVADAAGVSVRTVKRWEAGERVPDDVWDYIDGMGEDAALVVDAAIAKVLDAAEDKGAPRTVRLSYFRTQQDYDAHGRDTGPYGVANANSRRVADALMAEGFDVEFDYPEKEREMENEGTAVVYVLTNPYEFGGNPRATLEPGFAEHEELRIEERRCTLPEGFSLGRSEGGRMYAFDECDVAWDVALDKRERPYLRIAGNPRPDDISGSYLDRMREIGCSMHDGLPLFFLKRAQDDRK